MIPAALAVVLGALLAGVATEFEAAGRVFVVSWIDLAGVAVAVAGLVAARRRGSVRLDVALAAYAAVVAVALLQAALRPDTLEILGGSSRFVTAALVLFGLSQLLAPADDGSERPDLPSTLVPLLGFGAVLGTWTVVELVRALADPHLVSFYGVKNAVVTPLGASNTLAGYLLVPAVVAVAVTPRDRRAAPVVVIATLGIAATLSRGGIAALLVALGVGAWARWLPRRTSLLTAAGAVATTLGVFTVVGPGTAPPPPPPPAAADAPLLDPVASDALAPASPPLTPSAVGRVALWRASAQAFVERPLLGVGLNRIEEEVTGDLRQPHDHAHNALLHALAESGLVGTAAYLSLWAAFAWRLGPAVASPVRGGLAVGAGALFLHAQVEALTYQRGIEVVLAVLLALGATLPGAGAAVRHR